MRTQNTRITIMDTFISLVAENGFHGTSMSMVAKEAGVATGTSYVHFSSKEELVMETYTWLKNELADYIMPKVNMDLPAADIYESVWMSTYEYYKDYRSQARYISQLEESPYFAVAQERATTTGNPLEKVLLHPNFSDAIVDLPRIAFGSLSIGVAIRLASSGEKFSQEQLQNTMEASWRAISKK